MAAVEKDFVCLVLLSIVILGISSSIAQALATESAPTKVSIATNATPATVHLKTSAVQLKTTEISQQQDLSTQISNTNETEFSKQQQAPLEENADADADTGKIAGIIIGVLGGIAIITSMVAFLVYKQYLHRNVTSMNFDNPVYRKTTEDQFSLEKNQYQPARSYPPGLEPLTSPGTNEFV